jgi:hypothetical protein
MVLTEEVLPLSNDPGQRLVLVSAEPGSTSAQSLALLATLVATEREERLRACGGDPASPSAASR